MSRNTRTSFSLENSRVGNKHCSEDYILVQKERSLANRGILVDEEVTLLHKLSRFFARSWPPRLAAQGKRQDPNEFVLFTQIEQEILNLKDLYYMRKTVSDAAIRDGVHNTNHRGVAPAGATETSDRGSSIIVVTCFRKVNDSSENRKTEIWAVRLPAKSITNPICNLQRTLLCEQLGSDVMAPQNWEM